MRISTRVTITTILLCTALCGIAQGTPMGGIYPSAVNPKLKILPASGMMIAAVRKYYNVYGEWPTSWQKVLDVGLIQVPLTIDEKHFLSPDKGASTWNLTYRYRGESTPPLVGGFGFDGEQPHTWDEFMDKMLAEETRPAARAKIYQVRKSKDLQLLLALESLCDEGMQEYLLAHATYPESWQQFLDSGFSPVDANSTNPYTHQRFGAPGQPNGFRYEKRGTDGYFLRVTDEKNLPCWIGGLL